MDNKEIMGIIEAILFVSGNPVGLKEIAGVLDMPAGEVQAVITNMKDLYNYERRRTLPAVNPGRVF
jgi:chromosome segregation and condensation protein ScpB